MLKSILPYVAKAISSDTLLLFKRNCYWRFRKITKSPKVAKVFLKIDDPYSYLLVSVLPRFLQKYKMEIRFYILSHLPEEMYPYQNQWRCNAFNDCQRLARLYELDFPVVEPKFCQEELSQFNHKLVQLKASKESIKEITKLFTQFWNGQRPDKTFKKEDLKQSVKRLNHHYRYFRKINGYLSASIFFEGESYWGLDRLYHLEKRILQEYKNDSDKPYFNRQNKTSSNISPPTVKPQVLTMYFSIRSPYSYLGLEKAISLATRFNLELEVKVVLPMLMRGLAVPADKKWYIFHDTKREAKAAKIEYGFVADPLGQGVKNCYAILEYAKAQNQSIKYLQTFARQINAYGVRSDTEEGLQKIVEHAGLSWQQARQYLNRNDWKESVEQNMAELSQLGLWGVPCFKFNNQTVWGQDRLWYIESLIKK